MIEDAPNLLLRQSFSFHPCTINQVLQCPTPTILHYDIDSHIFLINYIVEVSEDVYVVKSDEGVYFIDDMLLTFGRERAKGDLLKDDFAFGREGDSFEEV